MGEIYDQAIAELARFLSISFQDAADSVAKYSALSAADKWIKSPHKTITEVENYYKDNDHYLYELIPWNYTSVSFTAG